MEHLNWGLPVIIYLFLGGLGAGAAVISGYVLLRGDRPDAGGQSFAVARYGALIAPLPVIIGTAMIILELGSFQVGNWFRFLNLFTTINASPMSIGSWLLAAFIGLSLVYAYTFMGPDARADDAKQGLRRNLAMAIVPAGIGVAIYTGVLLGATPSRPFWNSPMLPVVFTFSALSTGVASILLARAVFNNIPDGEHLTEYRLTASDLLFVTGELLAIFLFVLFAYLTVGNNQAAISVILSGELALPFWLGVIGLGLLLPLLLEINLVRPKLMQGQAFAASRTLELVIPLAIIAGGFMLRYVVVVAGQVTGPVGI